MAPVASQKTIPQDQAFLDILEVVRYTLTITQGKSFYVKPLKTNAEEVLSTNEELNQLLKNSNILCQRHPLADRIDKIAISIYEKAWHSHNYFVESKADFDQMRRVQKDAIKCFDDLLCIMQIAKVVFHLSVRRLYYWISLVLKAEATYQKYCTAVQEAQLHTLRSAE